jgi:uncharacterized protein (UPF0332 family)
LSRLEATKHLEVAEAKIVSAQSLLEVGQYEDSLGRSYYAMFHAAQAILAMHGVDARTHRGLLHVIRERFSDTFGPEILTTLSRQQRWRESADYDVLFRASKEQAEEGVASARRVLDRVRKTIG